MAVALLVGGCGTGQPQPSGDVPSSEPVRTTAEDGEWRLSISAPRSVWRAGEHIAVTAELHWIGAGEGMTYYAAGAGPIVFDVVEPGGRLVEGIRTGDCAVHEIRANEPFATVLMKSNAFEPGDPNATHPQLRVPAGRWELRADVELYMPPAWCTGRLVRMEAAIVLDVR